MSALLEHLNGWVELLLFFLAAAVAVFGAYTGAKRQTAKGLAPLVGNPPIDVSVPLSQRLDELLRWLERLEARQMQVEREAADVRDDVGRHTREIEQGKATLREHEDRIGKLERRAENTDRALHLHLRSDSAPGTDAPR